MLLLAMAAPAILALGLLAGELAGYGDPGHGPLAEAAPQQPPPRVVVRPGPPDLLYQALVPLYQGIMPRPRVRRPQSPLRAAVRPRAGERKRPPRKVTSSGRKRPPARTAERSAGEFACAREWQDTWLWELCQERAHQTT
ncbi:hypothetical protein ACQP1V_05330 [Microtetraspora malaysiensis]|uniref:hypothetical protein n=1 Tax=Microtetraspora malaysiensis TaxID=161358 RepID=UPI003D938921